MSERLHMPDFLSGHNIRLMAVAGIAGLTSLVGAGCQPVEGGTGEFSCYTVGKEGGGINGPGHTTASGTKPIPNEVAAADLDHYYRGRARDLNGNGRISAAEVRAEARTNPLRLHVPGFGTYRIEDTGGAFKRPGRFDLAMWRVDCNRFGRQQLPYTILAT